MSEGSGFYFGADVVQALDEAAMKMFLREYGGLLIGILMIVVGSAMVVLVCVR